MTVLLIAFVFQGRERDAYSPGGEVEGLTSDLTREAPSDAPRFVFRDVAPAVGIAFEHFPTTRTSVLTEDMGSGAAWGDYDGDADADLYVVNHVVDGSGSASGNRLFRNDGGTFTDVTESSGLHVSEAGSGAVWGDFNGDGILDLWTTAVGRSTIYFQEEAGRFGAGRAIGPEGFWTGVSPGDFDRDGDLDVYVSGYVRFRGDVGTAASRQYQVEQPASLNPSSFEPERNLLFRNDGTGSFQEVGFDAGVANPAGRSLAATWTDFDRDGWLDLYVANDVSDNALFRNRGDGRFDDVSHETRAADYRGAMGLAVADWDQDRDFDLFVTHWIAQENALLQNLSEDDRGFGLRFSDLADRTGLGQSSLDYVGWATSFADLDLDGRNELFVLNGSTFQERADPTRLVGMRDLLYWNGGPERGFFDVEGLGPDERVGRGGALSDFDGDGDLDIVAVDMDGPLRLLQNDTAGLGRWLKVRLVGPPGNTDGLGSIIEVWVDGAVQTRQVGAQASYLSQNDPVQVFGLGRSAQVDSVVVLWLTGERTVATGIPSGRRLDVHPGGSSLAGGSTPVTSSRQETINFWEVYRQATRERLAENLDAATRAYRDALRLRPDHEDALYYSGAVHLAQSNPQAADSMWTHLLATNPRSSRAAMQLGRLRLCEPDAQRFAPYEATGYFAQAHNINRVETGPLSLLAFAALAHGDDDEATTWLDRVLASDPGNTIAAAWRAHLYDRRGEVERALDLLETSGPTTPEGLSGEGDTKAGSAMMAAAGACAPFEVLPALVGRPLLDALEARRGDLIGG